MSNLESLLLGGDSSSGESDNEGDRNTNNAISNSKSTSAVGGSTTLGASSNLSAAGSNIASVSSKNDSSTSVRNSNNDTLTQNLKNLYSPAGKKPSSLSTTTSVAPTSIRQSNANPIQARHDASIPISGERSPATSRPTHANSIPQPTKQQALQHYTGGTPVNTAGTGHNTGSSSSTGTGLSGSRGINDSDPFAPTPVSKIMERQQHKPIMPSQAQQQSLSHHQSHQHQRLSGSSMPPSSAPGPMSSRPATSGHPGRYMPQGGPPNVTNVPSAPSGATGSLPGSMKSATSSSSASRATIASRSTGGSGGGMDARQREIQQAKQQFLMFTKILLKYLESKDPAVYAKTKAIIKDCSDRNKRHEKGYESVTHSMRTRLKEVVDENYWKRAELYMKHFLEQKARSASSSNNSSGAVSSTIATPGAASASVPVPDGKGSSSRPSASRAPSSATSTNKPGSNVSPIGSTSAMASSKPGQRNSASASGGKEAASTAAAKSTSATSTTQPGGKATTKAKSRKSTSPTPRSATSGKAAAAAAAATTSATKVAATTTSGDAGGTAKSTTIASTGRSTTPTPPQSKSEAEVQPRAPREYKEMMEMIDHAVNLGDWTQAGFVLGSSTLSILSDEQKRLLDDAHAMDVLVQADPVVAASSWGRNNVVTSRVAWARIRLREQAKDNRGTPRISHSGAHESDNGTKPASSAWYNEEAAEQDETLAVLSEGVQIYLRSVLEKATYCARQRLDIDGARLWYQQATHPDEKVPLTLRLGCDVSRQVAQAQGNASLVCKRMEEALSRRTDLDASDRRLDYDTLSEATSVSQISLLPLLSSSIEAADLNAKREFEVYGGKDSSEPPIGSVTKKAKIEVVDFQMGMALCNNTGRHRASCVSAAFQF